MSNGYVASGKFQSELEAALGRPLEKLETPTGNDGTLATQLALLPDAVAAEVGALAALYTTFDVPELCGLRAGGFATLPTQKGHAREAVIEDFRGNEAGADAAMTAVEIYNAVGSPYVVVRGEVIGLLYESPSRYESLNCTLEAFLKMLIAADTEALRDGIDAGRATAATLVGERRARGLVLNRMLNRNS